MARTLVSLGSNLGDPEAALDTAVEGLRRLASGGLRLSARHATKPVGGPAGQRAFLNAAAVFECELSPQELLAALQAIEQSLDRERHERWAARTLDVDLLLYGEAVINEPGLRLPHPRMTFRPFVMAPAVEVAAAWRHPEGGQTLADLLDQLRSGRDMLRLLGDDGSVRSWVVDDRHDAIAIVDADDAEGVRLTIDVRPFPKLEGLRGPRLALADCPPEHWRDEVLAALQCVWPTGSR